MAYIVFIAIAIPFFVIVYVVVVGCSYANKIAGMRNAFLYLWNGK